MDARLLTSHAMRVAEQFPAVTQEQPFGPDVEVFKVHGRIFLLVMGPPDRPLVTVKADPFDAAELRAAFADIVTGHHMNKRHWISIAPGDAVDRDLLRELVTDSYRLVVARLPARRRPVDPETFGYRP
ncbi:MmcQ/YjbR family DNA-binding protein [Microbacterium betulae]|uniref:MmcQ/YjbR family DNA-binding protein n=1 Tax=Microbacterium betulae TaxID=2981139 RepID=A0AA97FIZ8_9MICO|nr:MmcQ/YjbR family DNA-binding protein [Microbacterium sp. AB]WOF23539.1 MmcQ/YjbR family DNA-binding protein [Microbacterium sp. AB]